MLFLKKSPYIIAEVGINHDGNIKKAKKLINAALRSGANAVKFQIYKTQYLMSKSIRIKKLKNYSPKKQFKLLKKNELSFSEFEKLKRFCDKKKIDFLATPFDNSSADFLVKLDVKFIKVASGDFNNFLFIDYLIKKKKHIIFSTGRMDFNQIKQTTDFLKKKKFKNYSILHCVSSYPTKPNEINLKTISFLKKKFKCNVGFSDHSRGIIAPVAAYMLGASIIEKHITLDREGKGPDHKASLEPNEFKDMTSSIKFLELSLGSETKKVFKSELKSKEKSQRSLFIKNNIKKGQRIQHKDLISLRPATGIKSFHYEKVINKKVIKNLKKNQILTWELLKR